MFVAEMVEAIAQRLEAQLGWAAEHPVLAPATVSPFPDDPERYRMRAAEAELLVAFGGANYGAPVSTDLIVQERTAEFDLTLLTRSLSDRSGAYGYIEAVRLALTGFRLAGGGSALRPLREAFLSHDSGVWRYRLVYAATVPAVEIRKADPAVPLRRITLADGAGDTVVASQAPTPEE